MSDKISPLAVVKEAVAITWGEKWVCLGLVLGSVLLVGVLVALMSFLVSGVKSVGLQIVITFIVETLVMVALVTAISHLAVTQQRGAGKTFPEKMRLAMWRVFVRGLILISIYLGSLLMLGLLAGLTQQFMPIQTSDLNTAFFLVGIPLVFLYLGILAFLLRLSVMVPGAAVGQSVSVRKALSMTRGYAWRMLGAFLLLVLLMVVVCLVMLLLTFMLHFIGFRIFISGFGLWEIMIVIVSLAVGPYWYASLLAMVAVWYEKLRLRTAGPEAEFEFAPEAAPESSSSYVGPYGDLSSD